MRKIVAIANVAGGTSKTTTAHALAVACVEYGKKVLLLDLDVSTSLTFKLGLENERITLTDFGHQLLGSKLLKIFRAVSWEMTVTTRKSFIGL
jgi:cellulose biosynthesis protein BcsQ